ncbi:hypothetical protein ACRAWF_19985 [Streptomyces sp. L7]
MPMGYDQSEYEMAGALRGAPRSHRHRATHRLRRPLGPRGRHRGRRREP